MKPIASDGAVEPLKFGTYLGYSEAIILLIVFFLLMFFYCSLVFLCFPFCKFLGTLRDFWRTRRREEKEEQDEEEKKRSSKVPKY